MKLNVQGSEVELNELQKRPQPKLARSSREPFEIRLLNKTCADVQKPTAPPTETSRHRVIWGLTRDSGAIPNP